MNVAFDNSEFSFASTVSWFVPETSGRPGGPSWFKTDYARTALDRVLSSKDRTVLFDRLDALIVDDEYFIQEKSQATKKSETPDEELAKLDHFVIDMPSFAAVLGSKAAVRLQRGLDDLKAMVRSVLKFADSLQQLVTMVNGRPAAPAAKAAGDVGKVSDFYYNTRIPLTIRKEFAVFLRAMMAWCALLRAQERGKKLPLWLANALADAFAGEIERLKLASTPKGLLKLTAALVTDLSDTKTTRAAFTRWRSEAQADHRLVYFPLEAENADLR